MLERAFELARSGECPTFNVMIRKLKSEGYDGVPTRLVGVSLRRQLRELCLQSQLEITKS